MVVAQKFALVGTCILFLLGEALSDKLRLSVRYGGLTIFKVK